MDTPRRTVRIPEILWGAAVLQADEEGTTVSELIRDLLATYLEREGWATR